MTGPANALEIWTVYDHPSDFPRSFVARKVPVPAGTDDYDVTLSSPNLETLREALADMGLVCLTRSPEDDPVIVESWL